MRYLKKFFSVVRFHSHDNIYCSQQMVHIIIIQSHFDTPIFINLTLVWTKVVFEVCCSRFEDESLTEPGECR